MSVQDILQRIICKFIAIDFPLLWLGVLAFSSTAVSIILTAFPVILLIFISLVGSIQEKWNIMVN